MQICPKIWIIVKSYDGIPSENLIQGKVDKFGNPYLKRYKTLLYMPTRKSILFSFYENRP